MVWGLLKIELKLGFLNIVHAQSLYFYNSRGFSSIIFNSLPCLHMITIFNINMSRWQGVQIVDIKS